MGDNIHAMMFVGFSCLDFHLSTLEEYYTGGLFLGKFNAITDGSFPIIFLYFGLGYFGNEWVQITVFESGQLYDGSPVLNVI
jgi:hypothetical protein